MHHNGRLWLDIELLIFMHIGTACLLAAPSPKNPAGKYNSKRGCFKRKPLRNHSWQRPDIYFTALDKYRQPLLPHNPILL